MSIMLIKYRKGRAGIKPAPEKTIALPGITGLNTG
jgi:hypothetical protein